MGYLTEQLLIPYRYFQRLKNIWMFPHRFLYIRNHPRK